MTALSMEAIRSRFTPLPLNLHLGFCIAATVVFLIAFIRRKNISDIVWALVCDATLILQKFNDKTTALAVGVCEVVMLGILAWLWFCDKKAAKLKAAEKEAGEKPEDNLEDIAKMVKTERRRLDEDKSVIDNAFEDN